MLTLPHDTETLIRLIQQRLFLRSPDKFRFETRGDLREISAVLFLLGTDQRTGEPCLILNKRSRHVRQPGDLCCPGGGVAPIIDFGLTQVLQLPFTPLTRWPHTRWWRRYRLADFSKLSLLLATGLREGFEEMRLNPLGVRFLGPMPAQQLVMFRRAIYPMVAWVNHQQHFTPNWEVERIVRIPLHAFFDATHYARYRISFSKRIPGTEHRPDREMPCFVYHPDGPQELLWGATYRITEHFLKIVFGYTPPPLERLRVIKRRLGETYLQGSTLT